MTEKEFANDYDKFRASHPQWKGSPEEHTIATTWFIRNIAENHANYFECHEEHGCIINDAEEFANYSEKRINNER